MPKNYAIKVSFQHKGRAIFTFALILMATSLFAQSTSHNIEIEFRDIKDAHSRNSYYLIDNPLDGNITLIDSIVDYNKSTLGFRINTAHPKGLYTLLIYYYINDKGGTTRLNFLYNQTDIKLSTTVVNLIDSMQVEYSDVNKTYFDFEKKMKYYTEYYQRLYKLAQFLDPADSLNYILHKRGQLILNKKDALLNQILSSNEGGIAEKYIRWKYHSELTYKDLENAEWLKATYLQALDFSDTLIQNLNLINTITSNYLALYKDENLSFEQQEEELIKAIDVLMNHYYSNQDLATSVLNNLVKEFKQIGMEAVALHINERYLLADLCSNPEAKEKILEEIDLLKSLQPGNKAPDFIIDETLNMNLYSVNSKYTLIIFWASWCSHCRYTIPQTYNSLKDNKDIHVITIAMDEDHEIGEAAIKDYPAWTHIQASKKWQDPLVLKYAIYATPTIYVLDDKHIIKGKAKNNDELMEILEE